MNSRAWIVNFFVGLFVLLRCVNDPSSPIHPLLRLDLEKQNDTSRVIIQTEVAKQHSLYRIVDDTCTLEVSYHAIINGLDSNVVDSVAVANDSAAFQSGTFYGIWIVPDSLFSLDTVRVYGCVSDETKHYACDLLTLHGKSPLP